MALYVRSLKNEEWEELETLIEEPEKDIPLQRLLIVLLSAQGHRVQEVGKEVDLHPINVRKWIHRFNAHGIEGLRSGKSPGRPPVFSDAQRRRIVDAANSDPRSLGRSFSRWSLQRLRKYLIEAGIVKAISVETIRQVLRANGVKHRSVDGWSTESSVRNNSRFAKPRRMHFKPARGERISSR